MKPRIIIVAGMYRSGSTWLFNCVRNALIAAELPFDQTGSCDVPGWNQTDKPILLVKAHEFVKEAADESHVILTSVRNIQDALGSWNRFRPHEQKTLSDAADWSNNLSKWRNHLNHRYCMDFDGFPFNTKENVTRITKLVIHKHIDFYYQYPIDPVLLDKVMRLNENTTPPSELEYDPTTFYFKNHITKPV